MKRVRVFRCARWKQQGFSLMEVSIVTAIVLLIAIVGIPAIGGYVIENKVPKVGEELQRFVASMKINAQGGGVTPYTGLDTGALANALRDSTVLSVQGTGAAASVAHGLGGSGTSGSGVVQVEPASVDGAGMGSAFTLTLTNVSHAACPALASVLQRVSEIISISGSSGAKVVKDSIATPATPYRAAQAQAQCSQGDVNTFVFTAR
ncbi:type 4 pilus major pilin [Achromobacter mucicolens]|uniref:type 4 pilus major pilin n=1 Tax=Achromobacter TaxID=222 RepID=UPI0006FF7918|nr:MULTISPECIES: type 4 pilus major pilin [Achromobacter]KRB16806.1 fimbrial protein [Achromobacter sp. Root170]MCP2518322.1 prepilin-type N-terminal cleavage/methylation domain-containing protein [Achromobacter mucicolens]MCU6617390.1 prepilin-type N-terminal cleavage/methylation domain-containing protein [Achromobacter mucicolens]MDF2863713.1 prepilin-type cleavage/methylation protein [Achromobacter mucicolens]MDG9968660.1 prepilin-type N-terminal cleavage/methylation domain-containing prote